MKGRMPAAADLLLTGTLVCLTVGLTAASVTQDVYQAEEHGNKSVTWLLPGNVWPMSAAWVYIDIQSVNRLSSVYLYDSRFEAEPYQHKLYMERVWCDTELAKKGRIECLFTDLGLNDTGNYTFIVVLNEKTHTKKFYLSVSAATPQTVIDSPKLPSRRRIWLYVGIGLFTIMPAPLVVRYLILARRESAAQPVDVKYSDV